MLTFTKPALPWLRGVASLGLLLLRVSAEPLVTSPADSTAFLPVDGISHVTTATGGFTFDVNSFLGASRYYTASTPITGQNTITFNLEAGHIWNGHETLTHVTQFVNDADAYGTTVADLYDRHATWVGMLIGGRPTGLGNTVQQQGMAPGTDLRSAAISTGWLGTAYATGFGISVNSYLTAFEGAFADADVVNSSFGYTDPDGSELLTVFSDALATQNPLTTYVTSAGNSGPAANTVGSPGAGYNTITVAALGGANTFDAVASFSSRAPQDFSYYDETFTLVSVAGVRAAVDIAAPGQGLSSAFYGGQTGGNDISLTGSTNLGTSPTAYSGNIQGTSFSSPIVAGGAALVASAAKTLPGLSANPHASESVVVKALLLNGADKTSAWDNGQILVNEGSGNFLRTTQSLDWEVGAGRMNLDRTFDQQVSGQTDVAGFAQGALGAVATLGWDYGLARLGIDNDYILTGILPANSALTATLTWLRMREWIPETTSVGEVAQADLSLSIWGLDGANNFTTLIAESVSDYNLVEHLSFLLPVTGRYGIRIAYEGNTFDNTTGDVWGTAGLEQAYGLAWQVVAVSEPSAWILFGGAGLAWLMVRRRRLSPSGTST
jgi:hypothetical protein